MRPIAFTLAALLLAPLLLAPSPAIAESCGGADAPCEIEGGFYHALAPDGPGPRKAVIFLHGWGGTGRGVIRNTGLTNAILARGYAVIAPQGMPRRPGDTGGSWNAFANPDRRDDVAFMARVVEDAVGRFDIDPGRVIAGGFSGGGMMTWRLACDAPESYAAFTPIAGLLWRPLPARCAGPVRLLHVHGWSDPVVPLEGRSVGGGRITQGDLFDGLDLLRAANGCARDAPDAYAKTGPYLLRSWTDCAEGSALAFAQHDGGHRIPTGWVGLTLDWAEGLDDGPF